MYIVDLVINTNDKFDLNTSVQRPAAIGEECPQSAYLAMSHCDLDLWPFNLNIGAFCAEVVNLVEKFPQAVYSVPS